MKKIIFVLALFTVCSVLFAVEATVLHVEGRVEYREAFDWLKLEEGQKIEKGTVISTGFKSQAVLEFKGAKITLGPLTRATVEELAEGDRNDSASLFIDSGKISADVNATNGKRMGFKVRSPIATASVRGTAFSFSSSGILTVHRGVVVFQGGFGKGGKSIPVAQGQESKTSPVTGTCSSPSQEMALEATGGMNSTSTLASKESVAMVEDSAPVNTASNLDSNSNGDQYAKPTVVVKFDF